MTDNERAAAVLAVAAGELRRWLEPLAPGPVDWDSVGSGYRFQRRVVPSLDTAVRLDADGTSCTILGRSATDVLHGTYLYLEALGYVFGACGPVPPETPPQAWPQFERAWTPPVVRRGIRQHINFPMDISGYPFDEAREYIRNLARMRFNLLVFHLYEACGWYPLPMPEYVPFGKSSRRAGRRATFYYSDRYPVPETSEAAAVVRNRRIFCPPELEAAYGTAEADALAQQFLRGLIDEAQRFGMHVVLSAEPFTEHTRNCFRDDAKPGFDLWKRATAEALRQIARLYPQTDEIELISRENCSVERSDMHSACVETARRLLPVGSGEEAETLVRQLEADIAKAHNGHWMSPESIQGGWLHGMLSVEVALGALDTLRNEDGDVGAWFCARPCAVGLYLGLPGTLPSAARVLDQAVPEDVRLSWIPAHGACKVDEALASMNLSAAQARRLRVYSWAEIDGSMYTLQFPREGLAANVRRAAAVERDTPGAQGIAWHHWRTAENEPGLLFAAAMSADGLDAETVRKERLAPFWGVADGDALRALLDTLQQLDTVSIRGNASCGFCFFGCWWNLDKAKDLMWLQSVQDADVEECLRLTAVATDACDALRTLSRHDGGRKRLDWLRGFLDATAAHLRCVATLRRMRVLRLGLIDPQAPTEAERVMFDALCVEALGHARAWLRTMSATVADRGVEGSLASYEHTIVRYIRAFRGLYGGEPYDPYAGETAIDQSLQAPPLLST